MISHQNSDVPQISRRIFLGSTASIAMVSAIGIPSTTFGQETATNGFLAVSQRLTGMKNLNEDTASAMLDAFKRIGKGEAVKALISGEEDKALEHEVVAAWYSGTSPDPDAADVLTYTDALMWQAMLFTKPMGYCGGSMGYWADPPAA